MILRYFTYLKITKKIKISKSKEKIQKNYNCKIILNNLFYLQQKIENFKIKLKE